MVDLKKLKEKTMGDTGLSLNGGGKEECNSFVLLFLKKDRCANVLGSIEEIPSLGSGSSIWTMS